MYCKHNVKFIPKYTLVKSDTNKTTDSSFVYVKNKNTTINNFYFYSVNIMYLYNYTLVKSDSNNTTDSSFVYVKNKNTTKNNDPLIKTYYAIASYIVASIVEADIILLLKTQTQDR